MTSANDCRALAQDFERSIAVAAVAVDGKVAIEAGSTGQPPTFHDRKTRPVDDGELLIRKRRADGPSNLQVSRTHFLNVGHPSSYALPVSLGCSPMYLALHEEPALHEDMIGREQVVDPCQQ